MNPAVVLLYGTAPSLEAAEEIAAALVGEKLAACANLFPGMRSLYCWRGAVERAEETAMLFKTTDDLVSSLTTRYRELHPYELPALLALPVTGGLPPFLDWIIQETHGEPDAQILTA